MAARKPTVAKQRQYVVLNVEMARTIGLIWLKDMNLGKAVKFGLPEVDDRYHIWRVPLLKKGGKKRVGEIVIDAKTSLILQNKSTSRDVIESRLLGRDDVDKKKKEYEKQKTYRLSPLRNTIVLGNSEKELQDFPTESVDLVFTSPPYFNARPEYTDYLTYEEYLLKIRKVIREVHRVLAEGRFFVMNVSPVLIRRASRNDSSKRIAVPFDIHKLFIDEGYDFIDDIIWVKPSGAGWATGRGRRFSADRHPLQYKAVPVTEYVLVYRKHTDKLIDWNIRAHPNQRLVNDSRIEDNYERTNIWKIKPANDKRHPAIFPLELAKKVITYYSFKNDVVLDPFAGIGTVGKAAIQTERRFVLIEISEEYVNIIREEAKSWLGKEVRDVLTKDCSPIDFSDLLI